MVYVVGKYTKQVYYKLDAWLEQSVEKACEWASVNGWKIVADEITEMGSMILWVI